MTKQSRLLQLNTKLPRPPRLLRARNDRHFVIQGSLVRITFLYWTEKIKKERRRSFEIRHFKNYSALGGQTPLMPK